MRSASAPLVALLALNQFLIADLYTITLAGGGVVRWTNSDIQLTDSARTFALGPRIERSKTKLNVGIEVDSLDLTLYADSSITINGVPLVSFVAAGGFDGATVQLERVFMATAGDTSAGTLMLFSGRVADVEAFRNKVQLKINSDLELLNVQIPRYLYQPGCMNTLYDSNCGQSRAALTVAGSVTGTYGDRKTVGHALAQAAGYFDLGVLTFTSGANNGVGRTVKQHTSGQIVVVNPFPADFAVADTFNIYPGCDNKQSTCSGKFANIARFRGAPFIPVPETVT